MKIIGVVVADSGAAIVTVERDEDNALLCTAIERLPFDLAAVIERVEALDDPDVSFMIDSDGLGSALWTFLGGPGNAQHFQLYTGRGLDPESVAKLFARGKTVEYEAEQTIFHKGDRKSVV